ncbi:hypothetical protein EVAR_73087_1, partial [Eumeta japonica]
VIPNHGITIYGWTSKANINKLNASINTWFRTASCLLRTTSIPKLTSEANFKDFVVLWEERSVNLASRSITLGDDGLHHSFWKNAEIAAIKTAFQHSANMDFRGKIILLWVPSHMEIIGNEHADVGAREALELLEVAEVPCFARALSGPFRYRQNNEQLR